MPELRHRSHIHQEEGQAGQAIAEFALVLPVLMLMLLGFAELSFAVANRAGYQNGVDVLAQWAAEEMAAESWPSGWTNVVKDEVDRTGCDDRDPSVTFPDGSHLPGDRVLVRWACPYHPTLTANLFDFTIHVESEAVVPGAKPTPSPSPSSSP